MKVKYEDTPYLQVRFQYGGEQFDLDCVVDSGASDCVFPVDLADVLGIDLSCAPDKEYGAVGGGKLIGKLHTIDMQVAGLDDKWTTVLAGFLENEDTPILGRSGFFENYEVTFRHFDQNMEIISKKKRRPKPPRSKV